jgi:hypothetical protein
MKSALGHIRIEDVRLVVRGRAHLTDEEFEAHMAEALAMADSVRVVLVVVDDQARLSPAYRARLVRSGMFETPTAVVTDSLLARVEMTAMRSLGGNVRTFALGEFAQACDFLQIPPPLRVEIREQIARMRAALD